MDQSLHPYCNHSSSPVLWADTIHFPSPPTLFLCIDGLKSTKLAEYFQWTTLYTCLPTVIHMLSIFCIMDDVKVVAARLRITANDDLRRHTQRACLTSLYHNRGASERNVAFSESHQCQSLVPAPPPASQVAPMLRKLHSKPTCIYGVSSSAVGRQTTHFL